VAIIFGPDWERDLWTSPYRLGFELSGSGSYVNMFTRAYDRARHLARAALPGEVFAVIAVFPDRSKDPPTIQDSDYDLLHEMGVPTIPFEATWTGYFWPGQEGDNDELPCEYRAVRVTWDQADILLWSNLACDIGLEPMVNRVCSKLVDIARGVTVNAYDDRGMDITALSADPIAELYTRFDAWLLDYDRPRMSETFEGQGIDQVARTDEVIE
jgi:hypothetical protein